MGSAHAARLPHLHMPRPASSAGQAIAAADANRWGEAHDIAERSGDPVLKKLIEWMDLSRPGTDANFDRIATFIRANPDWPSMGSLKKRAEEALQPTQSPAEILRWFGEVHPVTPDGTALYHDALMASGREAEAEKVVRDFWVSGTFSPGQENEFLAHFGSELTKADHEARADRLIWDGLYSDARALEGLLGSETQALVRARLAFATDPETADAALAAVPEALRRDPGLTYNRIKFYREQERDEEAIALLDKNEPEPHPALWWTERNILARRALDRKEYENAYRLARDRRQTDAAQIADADFLAGWIALRFLNKPSVAAEHFAFMHEHVTSPASKARAAYWRARAAEALGEPTEEWLERAARYETNFYGQLAAQKLHHTITLPPEPKPTAEDQETFSRSELVRAARLLHANTSGPGRAELFVTRLGEIEKTPGGQALTARLAREINAVPLSVTLAKHSAQNNIAVLNEGYPVLTGLHVAAPEPALVHAIIRQESLFNDHAVSPAGAIGLMQLMPATANAEARKLNIKHTTSLLSESPAHNVTLGAAYLDDMINNFNGSYVLAIASYNAGPGHVKTWLADNGDPRTGDVDPIDWIELIPLPETRNYVQRVLENTEIYRSRLSGRPVEARLEEDLRR